MTSAFAGSNKRATGRTKGCLNRGVGTEAGTRDAYQLAGWVVQTDQLIARKWRLSVRAWKQSSARRAQVEMALF